MAPRSYPTDDPEHPTLQSPAVITLVSQQPQHLIETLHGGKIYCGSWFPRVFSSSWREQYDGATHFLGLVVGVLQIMVR